jgi:hypothetical protein
MNQNKHVYLIFKEKIRLMKYHGKMIIILFSLSLAMPQITTEAKGNERAHHHCNWHEVAQFKNGMRKLWIDHVVWTKDYIKSSLAGLEDREEVLARLSKNQDDIGNAIKPYYGEEAGNKLAALLRDHIVIAGKLVEAANTNDQESFNKLNSEWYENADDIVKLLIEANPEYDEKELKEMMYMHLKLVTDQAVSRVKKDWEADIRAFDQGEDHMIHLADVLSMGIKKQFPEKFQCQNKK